MAGIEAATYINQLNPLNPDGTLDYLSSGDDHLRLIKSTIQNTFSRVTGPVSASDADLTNTTYLLDTSVTANTITLTFSPVWTDYVTGKGAIFKIANTNTGPVTVNINGLGAVSLKGASGQALVGGELIAGGIYRIAYDGASFRATDDNAHTKVPTMVIAPYTGTHAALRNSSTGMLSLGTNGNTNIVCYADGSTSVNALYVSGTATINGALSVNGVTNQGFASGTRLLFAQGYAPTGWTQDNSDTANNRMLRVIIGAGGNGGGGWHDPTLMNVVPAHTHGFSTGTVSNDHTHIDYGHTHGVVSPMGAGYGQPAGGVAIQGNTSTGVGYASLSGITANHTHSGGTDNGSSQTTWNPRYLNLIMCTKN